jgi:carbon storage regulator
MLVLSRKQDERLIIGENIVVKIVRVSGGRVKLGIEAPAETTIRREELLLLDMMEAPTGEVAELT